MLTSGYANVSLRRLNPLTRLLVSLTLVLLVFLVSSVYYVVLIVAVTLTIGFVGGVGSRIFRVLKFAVPMLLVAFLLWAFLHSYSLFYSSGGGFSLDIGAYMTLRLVALITAPLLFIATTTPSELVASLESLRLPSNFVFLLALTLRHLTCIADEYEAIKEAQVSRGLELDKGFLIKRVRNYIPVIIPLLIRSVEVADKVTLAMELKLYGRGDRTKYFVYEMGFKDLIVIFSFLFILVFSFCCRLFLGGV